MKIQLKKKLPIDDNGCLSGCGELRLDFGDLGDLGEIGVFLPAALGDP